MIKPNKITIIVRKNAQNLFKKICLENIFSSQSMSLSKMKKECKFRGNEEINFCITQQFWFLFYNFTRHYYRSIESSKLT